MVEDLIKLIESIDSPITLGAILIIAILALLWRYLDKKLQTVAVQSRDAALQATSAAERAKDIGEAIITNHGSKNLGDAIDRLTENSFVQLELWSKSDKRVRQLSRDFLAHIDESSVVSEWVSKKMAEEREKSEAQEPHRVADPMDDLAPLESLKTER